MKLPIGHKVGPSRGSKVRPCPTRRHHRASRSSLLTTERKAGTVSGPLALVGGGEWCDGCDFDRGLLEAVGAEEVLVLADRIRLRAPATPGRRGRGLVRAARCPGPRADGAHPARRPRRSQRGRGAPSSLRLPGGDLADASPVRSQGLAPVGRSHRVLGRRAWRWRARRPARWCCATRWSIPAGEHSPWGWALWRT